MIDEICSYRTKGPTQALELVRHLSAHARTSTTLRDSWTESHAKGDEKAPVGFGILGRPGCRTRQL
jgi:hypothetical protein